MPALDGVRGLAILLVLVWHYFVLPFAGVPGSVGWQIASAGILAWSGVDLFFALSGYLLGSILIRYRGAANYYAAFYLRRICRIIPLYLLLLALYLACAAWLNDPSNPGHRWLYDRAMPFWSYASFTQNFAMAQAQTGGANFLAPTWSLAVEEQFYLFLPLIVAAAPPRALPWLAAALAAAAPLLRMTVFTGELEAFVLLPTRLDALLCGVLLAALLAQPAVRSWFAARRALIGATLGALFLVLAVMSVFPRKLGALTFIILALSYTMLIAVAVTHPGGAVAACLRVKWLGYLGVVSYSVYLFHQAVNGLVHAAIFRRAPLVDGPETALASVVALALTIGIALLTQRYIERPAIQAGRQVTYALRAGRK